MFKHLLITLAICLHVVLMRQERDTCCFPYLHTLGTSKNCQKIYSHNSACLASTWISISTATGRTCGLRISPAKQAVMNVIICLWPATCWVCVYRSRDKLPCGAYTTYVRTQSSYKWITWGGYKKGLKQTIHAYRHMVHLCCTTICWALVRAVIIFIVCCYVNHKRCSMP